MNPKLKFNISFVSEEKTFSNVTNSTATTRHYKFSRKMTTGAFKLCAKMLMKLNPGQFIASGDRLPKVTNRE